MGHAAPAGPRRTDLDWARIGAFGLLILYHVGMFYVPWDWELKSRHPLAWLQIPLDWTNPWRLVLLFIVSGAATRFMTRRLSAGALFKARSERLLLPLVFGVLLIVPPQAYVEAIERCGYHGGYLAFWGRYFVSRHASCCGARCVFQPGWKHLWYVAYLWTYTAVLSLALALAPTLVGQFERLGRRWLAGGRLLLLPITVLLVVRLALEHFFTPNDDFVDDWYRHAVFFLAFCFGFLFATDQSVWARFMRLRWIALALAIVAYALYAGYDWTYHGHLAPPLVRAALHPVYAVDQWAWTVAVLGFAHRYLVARDGPIRQYLTDAIFPYYIVHQTAIVVYAHGLRPFELSAAREAFLLIAATALTCALSFEIVRRIPWLRPFFGLKRTTARPQIIAGVPGQFDPQSGATA